MVVVWLFSLFVSLLSIWCCSFVLEMGVLFVNVGVVVYEVVSNEVEVRKWWWFVMVMEFEWEMMEGISFLGMFVLLWLLCVLVFVYICCVWDRGCGCVFMVGLIVGCMWLVVVFWWLWLFVCLFVVRFGCSVLYDCDG